MERKAEDAAYGGETRRRLEEMNARLYRLNLGMEEVKTKLAGLSRTLAQLAAAQTGTRAPEEGEHRT